MGQCSTVCVGVNGRGSFLQGSVFFPLLLFFGTSAVSFIGAVLAPAFRPRGSATRASFLRSRKRGWPCRGNTHALRRDVHSQKPHEIHGCGQIPLHNGHDMLGAQQFVVRRRGGNSSVLLVRW